MRQGQVSCQLGNSGVKLPARILFGKPEIDGADREVRVLAARDVGENIKHPTSADPPRNMHARLRRAKNRLLRKLAIGMNGSAPSSEDETPDPTNERDMHDHEHANDEQICYFARPL